MSKVSGKVGGIKPKEITESPDKNIPFALRKCVETANRPLNREKQYKAKQCVVCNHNWPSNLVQEFKCCKKYVCFECLHGYATYRITAGMEVKCPNCNKQIYPNWKNRFVKDLLETYVDKIEENKELRTGNKRICLINGCEGVVDMSAQTFKCNKCQKIFCGKCRMAEHPKDDCKNNYLKLIKQWKRCPECNIFRVSYDKCTHFSCEISQQACPVCFTGWSDKFYHHCQKVSEAAPAQIWFRDSIINSSWFLNIIRGIILAIGLPVYLPAILVVMLGSVILASALTIVIAPFFIIYQVCSGDVDKTDALLFFLCLPCGEGLAIGLIVKQLWEYIGWLPQSIITYIITTRTTFYYTNPYRQNHHYYTPFQVTTCRRAIYLIIMIIILPFMLFLPVLFFIIATISVFIFTLLSLPVVAYQQKSIPIWVSLIFFPIIFFHFLAIDFVGNFVINQLKQLVNFYRYYCTTMYKYMCGDQNQERSYNDPQRN